MPSLTLLHGLLIGNLAMFSLLLAFVWMLKHQQRADRRQMDERLALLEQSCQSLHRGTIGMGRRLKQAESRFQTVETTPQPVASGQDFKQASRLVGLGASVNDLVDNCGVARAEAELMVSLQRQRKMSI